MVLKASLKAARVAAEVTEVKKAMVANRDALRLTRSLQGVARTLFLLFLARGWQDQNLIYPAEKLFRAPRG
jgi:hypothetical protein